MGQMIGEGFPSLGEPIEPIPPPEFHHMVSGVLNHEHRLGVSLALLSDYLHPQRASQLGGRIAEAQGSEAVWTPRSTAIKEMCEVNLGSVGQFTIGSAKEGWRPGPQSLVAKMALIGCVSDWSLRYPEEISVQQVYGPISNAGDKVHGPELHHRVLELLLAGVCSLSVRKFIARIAQDSGATTKRTEAVVDRLVELGIIGKKDVEQSTRRQLYINEAACQAIGDLYDGLGTIREARNYKVIKSYAERAKAIFDSEEEFCALLNKSTAFSGSINTLPPEVVQKDVLGVLEAGGTYTLPQIRAVLGNRYPLERIRTAVQYYVNEYWVAVGVNRDQQSNSYNYRLKPPHERELNDDF